MVGARVGVAVVSKEDRKKVVSYVAMEVPTTTVSKPSGLTSIKKINEPSSVNQLSKNRLEQRINQFK